MPYAPGTEYRGDQYVAQGQAGMWQALGGILEHFQAKKERIQEEDKQRARKFKSLVDYADTTGLMPKDRAMTMDVDSLEGAVQGAAAKQKFDQVAAQLKQYQQQNEERQSLVNFAKDYAGGNKAGAAAPMANFADAVNANDWGALPQAADALAATQTPQNRMDFALGRNPGAFASPQFDNSLAALQRYGGGEAGSPLVVQDVPGTSMKAVWTGKNTPQLVYGGGDAGAPVPQHDEEGNVNGWTMTDARGRSHFYSYKGNEKVKPAMDSRTGEPIPGYYMTSQGKVMDTRTTMEHQGFTLTVGTNGGFDLKPVERAVPESPKNRPKANRNEVIRVMPDGKRVVYDADTKQPLRYAE